MDILIIIGLILILITVIVFEIKKFRRLKQSFLNSDLIRDLKDSRFKKIKEKEYSKRNKEIEKFINWSFYRNEINLTIGIEFRKNLNINGNFVKYALKFTRDYKNYGFNIGGKKAILKEYKIKKEKDIPSSSSVFSDLEKMIEISKIEKINAT